MGISYRPGISIAVTVRSLDPSLFVQLITRYSLS